MNTMEPKIRSPQGKLVKGIHVSDQFGFDPDAFRIPAFYRKYVEKIILTSGLLSDRIEKLAHDLYLTYEDSKEPIVLICVLSGAQRFYEKLTEALRLIHRDLDNDAGRPAYLGGFITAKSYLNTKSTGKVRIESETCQDVLNDLEDKHVILIEDMVDTGRTLKELVTHISNFKPKSLRSMVLFTKRVDDWNGFEPDWVGFDLPSVFIVGYGADLNGLFRDLDCICVPTEEAKRSLYKPEP